MEHIPQTQMNKKHLSLTVLSVLFLSTFCTPLFALDAQFGWLPENINPVYGDKIDYLYKVIMVVVGIAFFLTEGTLLFCIFAFRSRPGHKAKYSHGNLKAELFWSVLPCVILVWLALVQRSTWMEAKVDFPEKPDLVIQAFPEQFQWNFRYPGEDGKFGTQDDFALTGNLHIPVNKTVVVDMTAKDVIHSFFLPHARVKQDAVPGMKTRVWFKVDKLACWDLKNDQMASLTEDQFRGTKIIEKGYRFKNYKVDADGQEISKGQLWPGYKRFSYEPTKSKTVSYRENGSELKEVAREEAGDISHALHYYEVACAELCGLGHYKMSAKLVVMTDEMFSEWQAMRMQKFGESKVEKEKFQDIWDKHFAHFNR